MNKQHVDQIVKGIGKMMRDRADIAGLHTAPQVQQASPKNNKHPALRLALVALRQQNQRF